LSGKGVVVVGGEVRQRRHQDVGFLKEVDSLVVLHIQSLAFQLDFSKLTPLGKGSWIKSD
jgi:hypothetical protein